MTLVLGMGNTRQVVMVADDRLTGKTGPLPARQTKITVCSFATARCLMAFTGLATATRFRTDEFLLKGLLDESRPNYAIAEALDGLRARLTARFRTLYLEDPTRKRLSVYFLGYDYGEEPPRLRATLVSNFERWGRVKIGPPDDEFSIWHEDEKRPRSSLEPAIIQIVGVTDVLTETDTRALMTMLERRAAPRAIIGKGAQLVRKVADDPRAANTISKNLLTAVLYRDPVREFESAYLPDHASQITYGVNYLIAVSDDQRGTMRDLEVKAVDPEVGSPMVVPTVGRNKPCPCGSGKKFKKCHGR
jgi:SEC-C motif-containing protein